MLFRSRHKNQAPHTVHLQRRPRCLERIFYFHSFITPYFSNSISIAKSGHRSSQSLQQIQSCGRAALTLSSPSSSKTFFGQNSTQMPQPLHQSRLIWCCFNLGFPIKHPLCQYPASCQRQVQPNCQIDIVPFENETVQ